MSAQKLSHVTGESLATALEGFSQKFAGGWNNDILAAEVRSALAGTIPPESVDPSRLSNIKIRQDLVKLSKETRALDGAISKLYSLANDRLMQRSFTNDGFVNFIGFIFNKSSQYFRFRKAASELSFLADFLETAASNAGRQGPRWRQSEQRRLMVWRGEALIPIFESAFGQTITLNRYPSDPRHRTPTLFMDFYQLERIPFSLGHSRMS